MKKRIALCLALFLLIQSCALGASARSAGTEDVYTGTILAAVNTNYDDMLQDFAAEAVGSAQPNVTTAQTQAQTADELLDGPQETDPQPLSAAEAKAKEAALGQNAQDTAAKADYHVGDRKNIYSSYHTEFDSKRIDVECIYTNDLCTVWREDGLNRNTQICVDVAENFCALLPREWEMFGDRRIDADGDGKIALIFQTMDSGVGGYFSSGDLVDKLGRIGSVWVTNKGSGNAWDCVHLYPYADFNTVLHEYQHYLHCSWKYAGKNNLTCIYNDHESFINEGFSGCAEALLGTHDRSPGFRRVMDDPTNYSPVNWSFDGGSYTLSYVFCQYMRTRYALLTNDLDSDIPGSGFFRRLLQTRSEKYVRNTLSIAADLLYPKAQYPALKTSDSRCRELIKDFWIAVLRKDESGIHGFNGESWAENLTVPVSELPESGSPLLRSGMAIFCRIPMNDPLSAQAGSAHITRAGSELRFVGVSDVGRALILDPRNDGCPIETIFTLADNIDLPFREDVLIPGRSFLGWSVDPQRDTVKYTFYENIPLADGSKTLYGVWADAPTLTTRASVRCSGASANCVRFTPESDGFYLFTATNGSVLRAEADSETLEPQWRDASTERVCYALQAGRPIDLFFVCSFRRTGRLSAQRVDRQYALCCTYTLCGETHAETIGGSVQYDLPGLSSEENQRAIQNDLLFLGWSEDPDAKTAAYLPLDRITLRSDTTLYGVWHSIPSLIEGADLQEPIVPGQTGFDTVAFTCTPQTSGTYRFTFTPENYSASSYQLNVFDRDQTLLRSIELEALENGVTCDLTLQGGQKYRFVLRVSASSHVDTGDGACLLHMEKRSAASLAKLTFAVPSESGTLFDGKSFSMKLRYSYTIPNWDLEQNTRKSPLRLAGWSVDPKNPNETVYRPGDRIEPLSEITLYPVLEPVSQTRLSISVTAYLWRTVRAYLRFAGIRVLDAIR